MQLYPYPGLQSTSILRPESLLLYITNLAASGVAWEGWSHRYEGTSTHYTGVASLPENAAWFQKCEFLQEEPWARCWQEPGPNSTHPPDGCCQWPGRQELCWAHATSPGWGELEGDTTLQNTEVQQSRRRSNPWHISWSKQDGECAYFYHKTHRVFTQTHKPM